LKTAALARLLKAQNLFALRLKSEVLKYMPSPEKGDCAQGEARIAQA
jgi:hypothetical protein